jgi:hypothetical protein
MKSRASCLLYISFLGRTYRYPQISLNLLNISGVGVQHIWTQDARVMFENGISVVSLTQRLQQDQQRARHGIAFLLMLQMLSHSQQRSKVLSQLLPEKLVHGTFNCTPLLTAKLLWQNCCLVFILFCFSLQLSSRVSIPNASHKIVSGPRAHNSV